MSEWVPANQTSLIVPLSEYFMNLIRAKCKHAYTGSFFKGGALPTAAEPVLLEYDENAVYNSKFSLTYRGAVEPHPSHSIDLVAQDLAFATTAEIVAVSARDLCLPGYRSLWEQHCVHTPGEIGRGVRRGRGHAESDRCGLRM